MKINPVFAKSDQPYRLTHSGRTFIGIRNEPSERDSWALVSAESGNVRWVADDEVTDLVPLVPGRKSTLDDLPDPDDLIGKCRIDDAYLSRAESRAALDAVVAHLNERGGIPAENPDVWGHCTFGSKTEELTQRLRELGFAPSNGIVGSSKPAESKQFRWEGFPFEGGDFARDLDTVLRKPSPRGETNGAGDCGGAFKPSAENLNAGGDVQPKSCCEEAQLTAAELARRNEELAEAEGEIAALTKRAETERGERERLSGVIDGLNEALGRQNVRAAEFRHRAEKAESERDELQESIVELQPAENRPTLDREAVEAAIYPFIWGDSNRIRSVDAIMALVPAAEGWPEWLGPKVDPDDFEVTRDSLGKIRVDGTFFGIEGSAKDMSDKVTAFVHDAALFGAVARFIESEQAATGDEDQRVEELFELVTGLIDLEPLDPDLAGSIHDGCRAAVNAKWTPPESEATE